MSNPKHPAVLLKLQCAVGGTAATTTSSSGGPSSFIDGQTGQGGYGNVCAVKDQIGAVFALKRPKDHTNGNERMMRREIEMLEHAGEHHRIAKFFGSFVDPRGIGTCLLFEIYDPRNLHRLLKDRKGITEEETRLFGKQIAEGVAYLHSRGLIHGDLKPDNILVDPLMNLKVADLGLAKVFGDRKEKNNITKAHINAALFIVKGSTKMSVNIKDLIELLLSYDPQKRPAMEGIWCGPFFRSGYTPFKLPCTVFDKAPVFPKQPDNNASSAVGGQVDIMLSAVQLEMLNKKRRIEESCVEEKGHAEEHRTDEKNKVDKETHHVDKKHCAESSCIEEAEEEDEFKGQVDQDTGVGPQVAKHQSVEDRSEARGQEEEDEDEAVDEDEDEDESQQLSSNARQSAEIYKSRIMRHLTFGEALDSLIKSGDVGDDEDSSLPSFPSF
ncbi:Cell cycle serine/threonine-protein kinase cdc5/MSD2 [Mortierella sp. NVP41]|nr:Cell cycle serine/threonine-protein kinase cdc5/MSD2 [Mortierella sp. NVP41]